MKKARSFTLIELLVVISIIGILAGLVLSGLDLAKRAAMRTKAKAQISALLLACKQFETQYGVLPADGATTSATLLPILSASTPPNTKNPRNIPFLVPTKITGTTPEFKDPWGNDFSVALSDTGTITAGSTYETVYNTAAVWSWGPNKYNDKGEFNMSQASGGGGKRDDINSWR